MRTPEQNLPDRLTNHPALLMLMILKRGRRELLRKSTSKEQRMRLPHYAIGALLADAHALSQKEVSDRLATDPSDLVTQIDEMEKAGLVTRMRDATDRRRYRLNLTEAGQRYMSETDQKAKGTMSSFLAPLTKEEQAEFMRLLRKLLERGR